MTSKNRGCVQWMAAALAAAVLLSACASDGPRGRRGGGVRGSDVQMGDPGARLSNFDMNALYRRATTLKTEGNCGDAVPLFQVLARQGPGYDGAQQALAECLFDLADVSLTNQLEALVWLRRAAEAGRAEAQGRLALVYLDGPDALRNHNEALFWYAIYRTTPSRGRVGFTPLSTNEEMVLSAAFDTAALATVADAIALWQPVVWIPTSQPELSGPSGNQGGEPSGRRDRRRTAEL